MTRYQGEAFEGGLDGSYDDAVLMWRDGSGRWMFRDVENPAGKSLSELLSAVPAHSITSHSDLATDFASQYYNATRLAAYLADAGAPPVVAVSGDVAGNATAGAHVADAAIHQRVPKFVLRVAKGGQTYSTVSSALGAIPSVGPDAPGPDQWWMIEVAPGTYAETLSVSSPYVIIRGAGAGVTKIRLGNAPVVSVATNSNVVLERLTIETTNGATTENVALKIGSVSGTPAIGNVTVRDCVIVSPGLYAVRVYPGTSGVLLERCLISAMYGAAVKASGPVELDGCTLATEAITEEFPVLVDGVGNGPDGPLVVLRRCRAKSGTYLLGLKSSAVRVEELICNDSMVLATSVAGNVSSSVDWTRISAIAEGQPAEGAISVAQVRDAGLSTRGSVLVNWQTTGYTSRSGIGAGGVPVGLIGGYNALDHQWVRYLIGGTPTGEVGEFRDRSTAGSTNALKLTLGASIGKFARWVSEAAGVETELGYIGRDGKVYAPGFVGPLTGAVTGSLTGSVTAEPSTSVSSDFAGSTFGATASHVSGNMALLRGARFKSPSRTAAGTVTDAVALDVEAVTGVGTGRNLSALFRGAIECQDDVTFTKVLTGHNSFVRIRGTGTGRAGLRIDGAQGSHLDFYTNGIQHWAFYSGGDTLSYYNYTGTAGDVFVLNGGANKGSVFNSTGAGSVDMRYGGTSRFKADSTGIGFYGVAPVARQAVAAAAGATPTQAEFNALRNALVAVGIIQ